MKKHTMFEPVLKSELLPGTNVIDSTWAMKKKANGVYHEELPHEDSNRKMDLIFSVIQFQHQ